MARPGQKQQPAAALATTWTVIAAGAVALCVALCRLPAVSFDLPLALLAAVMILAGSRLAIDIPGARGSISVSDSLVFVVVLLYGGAPAVLLAAAEVFVLSRRRFSLTTSLFNVGATACATGASTHAVEALFGDPAALARRPSSVEFAGALVVLALAQFVVQTALVALRGAKMERKNYLAFWREKYLWSSLTYFAAAAAAGVSVALVSRFGCLVLCLIAPVIGVLFWSYRAYTGALAKSAAHVAELSRVVAEKDRALRAEERLRRELLESQAHLRSSFDDSTIGMAIVEPDGRWSKVNRALCEYLGYTEDEFLATNFKAFTHPDDAREDLMRLCNLVSSKAGEAQTAQSEKRYITRDGRIVWALDGVSLVRDHAGNPKHFIFQIVDLTERKRLEQALEARAITDAMTGLPNMEGFLTFARPQVAEARRARRSVTVFYADGDNFKAINDTWGHDVGDDALRDYARILRESFREYDVVARLGGDEFGAFAVGLSEGQEERLASRIQERLRVFNESGARPYKLALSVGRWRFEGGDPRSLEEMKKFADDAMYKIKEERKRRQALTGMPVRGAFGRDAGLRVA